MYLEAEALSNDGMLDLIPCITVLEHMPADSLGLLRLWFLLKPSGTLTLTVRCMQRSNEPYINTDTYDPRVAECAGFVSRSDNDDSGRLRQRVYCILDEPATAEAYGEPASTTFPHGARHKRLFGPAYSFWHEPHATATEYYRAPTNEDLAGVVMVAQTFIH